MKKPLQKAAIIKTMDNEIESKTSAKKLDDRERYLASLNKRQLYARSYYNNNKKAVIACNRKWRSANRQKERVTKIIKRAKSRGLAYDKMFLYDLKCPDFCPVLGTPISFDASLTKKHPSTIASFDRIDNNLGYVSGNVQIISKLANSMKNCANKQQLISFAQWVLRNEQNLRN